MALSTKLVGDAQIDAGQIVRQALLNAVKPLVHFNNACLLLTTTTTSSSIPPADRPYLLTLSRRSGAVAVFLCTGAVRQVLAV